MHAWASRRRRAWHVAVGMGRGQRSSELLTPPRDITGSLRERERESRELGFLEKTLETELQLGPGLNKLRTSASDLSPPSALPRGRREFWPTAEPERRAVVPKKSKEEVASPGVVKKEGRKKVAGQKMGSSYGRTAATASRAVRGRELALLCFALPRSPPLPSPPLPSLVSHWRECFSG